MLIAGLSNLVGGSYVLGTCRVLGVTFATLAYFAIGPAYTEAMRQGHLSPLVVLVYLPLALGEITGRVISERALQRSNVRIRSLGADSEGENKA